MGLTPFPPQQATIARLPLLPTAYSHALQLVSGHLFHQIPPGGANIMTGCLCGF